MFGPKDGALQDALCPRLEKKDGRFDRTRTPWSKVEEDSWQRQRLHWRKNCAFSSPVVKVCVISTCAIISAVRRVSFRWIGQKAIHEYVNSVCTTRNFAETCWLLRNIRDQCEDIRLNDGPCLLSGPISITRFSITQGLTKTQLSCHSRTNCMALYNFWPTPWWGPS